MEGLGLGVAVAGIGIGIGIAVGCRGLGYLERGLQSLRVGSGVEEGLALRPSTRARGERGGAHTQLARLHCVFPLLRSRLCFTHTHPLIVSAAAPSTGP